MDTDLILHLIKSIDRLEKKVDAMAGSTEAEWVNAKEMSTLLGMNTDQLMYQVRKGRIGGDSIKNVGTVKKPRYRFHRSRTTDQFLNGVPA